MPLPLIGRADEIIEQPLQMSGAVSVASSRATMLLEQQKRPPEGGLSVCPDNRVD